MKGELHGTSLRIRIDGLAPRRDGDRASGPASVEHRLREFVRHSRQSARPRRRFSGALSHRPLRLAARDTARELRRRGGAAPRRPVVRAPRHRHRAAAAVAPPPLRGIRAVDLLRRRRLAPLLLVADGRRRLRRAAARRAAEHAWRSLRHDGAPSRARRDGASGLALARVPLDVARAAHRSRAAQRRHRLLRSVVRDPPAALGLDGERRDDGALSLELRARRRRAVRRDRDVVPGERLRRRRGAHQSEHTGAEARPARRLHVRAAAPRPLRSADPVAPRRLVPEDRYRAGQLVNQAIPMVGIGLSFRGTLFASSVQK